MKIVEVIPKDNYLLYIIAQDGQMGLFDVKPYLESEAFAPLKENRIQFERIHNGTYFIEWDCGADLSSDTIQARWETIARTSTQQGETADARKPRG
jgi:hypothetical protein